MSETPMQGLADWLRSQDVPGYSGPHYERLRRWASEVEAARASLPAPLPDEAMDSKPVAYLVRTKSGKFTRGIYESIDDNAREYMALDGDTIIPLFAAPPSDAAMAAESDTALLRQCLSIGSRLSDMAFAMKQREGHALTKRDCDAFEQLQREYDAAITAAQQALEKP